MTLSLTELDQRTRDELQPPCETGRDSNPATRVAHWHVECDHLSAVDLLCTDCADRVVRWVNALRRPEQTACAMCQAPARLLRIEVLR